MTRQRKAVIKTKKFKPKAQISENATLLVVLQQPAKVSSAALEDFIARSADATGDPRFMVGRVHQPHVHLVAAAVAYGLEQRNVPYDVRYLTDQTALYCSELVVDMFKYANAGTEFFREQPMSFRDNDTGQIHPFWTAYYERLGMPVPAGELGSNPGAISRDVNLQIYNVVGAIPGFA